MSWQSPGSGLSPPAPLALFLLYVVEEDAVSGMIWGGLI